MSLILISFATLWAGLAIGALCSGNERFRPPAIAVVVISVLIMLGTERFSPDTTINDPSWSLYALVLLLLGPGIGVIAGLYLRIHNRPKTNREKVQ